MLNPIYLEGSTDFAGEFGWYEGIRVRDILRSLDAGLRTNADRDIGLVVRRVNEANEIVVIDLPPKHFNVIDHEENLYLRPFDKVVILLVVNQVKRNC